MREPRVPGSLGPLPSLTRPLASPVHLMVDWAIVAPRPGPAGALTPGPQAPRH